MKRPQGFDPEPQVPERPRADKRRPGAEPRETSRSRSVAWSARPAPKRDPRPREKPRERSRGLSAEREARRAARQRRRAERREVRRFTKRSRTQRAAWLSALGVVAALGGLLAVAVFSPLLAFERLEIRGIESVDEAVVRAAVEDQLGTPLALLDHDAIREALSQIPRIRSFTTEVTPPGTLTIHLVEREAIGALRTESGFAVVDAAGVVLSRTEERPEGLPRINVDAQGASGVGFAAAVEVLLALPEDLRANVDSAVASTRDDVRLTLRGGGESVVWGSADRSDLKARVLERLLAARPAGSKLEFDVSAPLSPVVRTR